MKIISNWLKRNLGFALGSENLGDQLTEIIDDKAELNQPAEFTDLKADSLEIGHKITSISADPDMISDSDLILSTQKAVKKHVYDQPIVSNRIIVGPRGHFSDLKAATDWFNAHATFSTEILIDSGMYPISDTILVNNLTHSLRIRGLGTSATLLQAADGLQNKPMFDVRSNFDMNKVRLDGSTLAGYGVNPLEIGVVYQHNLNINSELVDIIIFGFSTGILDSASTWLFLFNFIISDCEIGVAVDNVGISRGVTDLEIGNFDNCGVGVDLRSSVNDDCILSNLIFNLIAPDICVQYDGANYVYRLFTISECRNLHDATFLSGFDFTLERDANIEVKSNIGVADRSPKTEAICEDVEVVTFMGTSSGTLVKQNFLASGINSQKLEYIQYPNLTTSSVTGNGSVVTVDTTTNHNLGSGDKVSMYGWTGGSGRWDGEFVITKVTDLRFTYSSTGNGTALGGVGVDFRTNTIKYMSKYSTELTLTVVSNIESNSTATYAQGIVKNGDTSRLYGRTILRVTTSNQPFLFFFRAYLNDVQKDDTFEVYIACTSAGNRVTLLRDLSLLIEGVK